MDNILEFIESATPSIGLEASNTEMLTALFRKYSRNKGCDPAFMVKYITGAL